MISTSVTLTEIKNGEDGTDAKLLYLAATSEQMMFDKNDTVKTQTITISAKLQNITGTATFSAIPYIGNTAQTAITLGGSGNNRTLTSSQFNKSWTSIAITATLDGLSDTLSVVKVKDGADGQDGKDGIAGKDGIGIKSTAVTYALADSGDTAPTTGWTATIPTLTKGRYLWTKSVWTYTDNSTETGYSVTYVAKDGNNGTDGIAGKDGVGIKATNIEYVGSTSGTVKPTTGWATTIPTVAAGAFLWTRTTLTYTDNTTEQVFSVAKMGNTGATGPKGNDGVAGKDGKGIKATAITYQASTNGTTAPTGTWSANVPTVAKGSFLWTRTIWTYTDNTTETGYAVAYMGTNGNDGSNGIAGKDGTGIKSTTITYVDSTNGTTPPISGWTTSIPTVADGNYLWTKTVWLYTDNTSEAGYSVAKMGTKGADGKDGDKGDKGDSASEVISGYLTNEAIILPADASGTVSSFANATGKFNVYEGNIGVSSGVTYTKVSQTGITCSIDSSGNYSVTAMSADSGMAIFRAVYKESTIDKILMVVKSKQGGTGLTGVGIKSVVPYFSVSASNTTEPTSWSTTVPTMTTTNKYLWKYETITYTNDSTSSTVKQVIGVYGNTGAAGATGATGKGISTVTNYYLVNALASGVTTSTSGWSTTPSSTTTTNKYLWNYEKITFTDSTTTSTTPAIISTHGATGSTGATGNGISTIVDYFLATTASSGVTISTSGWTTSIQTITTAKKYLWKYEKITYTSGTVQNTTPVIIGVYGDTGPQGNPTGVTESATVPSSPYTGMLWKHTGSVAGYIKDVTYRWNGSAWKVFIFTAENISVDNLAALSANLGTVTAGTLKGTTIISEFQRDYPYSGSAHARKGNITIENGRTILTYDQIQKSNNTVLQKGSARWDEQGFYMQSQQTNGTPIKAAQFSEEGIFMTDQSLSSYGQVILRYQDLMTLPQTILTNTTSNFEPYANSAGSTSTPTAERKMRQVQLSGAFKNKNAFSGSAVMATLPVGYRPGAVVSSLAQGSGTNHHLITVNPNGQISIDRSSGGQIGAGNWLTINMTYVAGDI